jgi:hypothetical protein
MAARREGWKIGRVEEWKDGGWGNSTIRQFDNGRVEKWKNGKMELWKTERKATAWRNIDRIDGQHEVWRCSAPKYPGKPQRGEMFVELAGN